MLLFLTAGALCVLPLAAGFMPILVLYFLMSVAQVPTIPLQDGISFSLQEQARLAGDRLTPFHHIRVWGTIGFIVSGMLLFVGMNCGLPVSSALYGGAICSVLAGLNTFRLPRLPERAAEPAGGLPTLAAAKVLFSRRLIAFSIASFLLQVAGAAYYGFYSIYLNKGLGLASKWAGPAANVGVVFEVAFMLSFGVLLRRLGMRNLLICCTAAVLLRMILLGTIATIPMAVGSQVLHGAMVLLMHVVPAVLLNSYAEDGFRHSMQGLYTMLIVGLGRIVGNIAAGPIAKTSPTGVYLWSAALVAVALVLLIVGFHDRAAGAQSVVAGEAGCEEPIPVR
jgi:PPP family 3-phenylpropionic acid transporter